MTTNRKAEAKNALQKLLEKYNNEKSEGRLQDYNEEATKTAFIQPLLKDVLGWDVTDRNEVSPEENVSRGRVDYGLKVNNQIRIFVEAKPIKADLNKHIEQAVRYGYNRKNVPFVLLTDFEGIKLFDVTVKLDLRNLLKGLKIDLQSDQYLDQFDKLWLLSKESVIDGQLENLLLIKPKERQPVDKAILNDLKEWREILAKDIYKNNSELFSSGNLGKDANYLKEITQKLLDRIIFMRSCEDRMLVHRRSLKEIVDERTESVGLNSMTFLKEEFKHYEIIFDSDLFSHREWEDNMAIDFKIIKHIVLETYNPYQFDVIPLEVLGNIYEQYLGYTIRLTEQTVKYELKPDVRKAGGVYYTPEYIVEYIVENTVGKLLKELPENKIKKLKILDPACGSGSFLIRAYDEMLKYYRDSKKKGKASTIGQEKLGLEHKEEQQGHLSILEKSAILCNHIFGVDIDEQAVEVTKLSLMLKMLEGEYGFVPGRAILPMLDKNIRCGNSLISGKTVELKNYFGDNWYRVKPFNWDEEFGGIVNKGKGFDVVIGNPPYFNINLVDKDVFRYLEDKYKTIHTGYNDIMYYFIYKGISILSPKGVCGFITSNYYLGNSYARPLRKYLKEYIVKLVNFKNFLVFSEANIHTSIIIGQKIPKTDKITFYEKLDGIEINPLNLEENLKEIKINREKLEADWVIAKSKDMESINSINNIKTYLGDIAIIEKGSTSGKNKIYTVSNSFAKEHKLEKEILRKNLKNSDIGRYLIKNRNNYLIYIDSNTELKRYPYVYKYLLSFKRELSERNEVKRGLYEWTRLERPRQKEIFDAPEKLVVPYRAERNKFAYDDQQYFNDGGDIRVIVLKNDVKLNIKYILGLLNSKLINWYYGFIGKPKGNSREYFNEPMAKIPIYPIDISIYSQKKMHDAIVALVDIMINLNKEYINSKGSEKDRLHHQIIKTDEEIDQLVYKLYNIKPEEIAGVEEQK